MEKISTPIDKKAILQMSKKAIIFTIIIIIVGIMGVIPSLICLLIFKGLIPLVALIISFAVLAVGLSNVFNFVMTMKKASKANAKIVMEFLDDQIVAYMFKNNVSVDQLYLKYNELFGYKVTKDFVFIYLNVKHSLPVDKSIGEEVITKFLESKGLKRI